MRVTARRLIEAFRAGKSKTVGNSSVEINPDHSVVFRLHGNAILDVSPEGEVSVSLADWPTVTTRSRINDLLFGLDISARVSQDRFDQYLECGGVRDDMMSREWYVVGRLSSDDLQRLRCA
jgi:hypothetical protein